MQFGSFSPLVIRPHCPYIEIVSKRLAQLGIAQMAKDVFIIIDTETTQSGMVADFAAIVCDRKGNILHETAILVGDFFSDKEKHPLFHIYGDNNDYFSAATLPKRYAAYEAMLQDGRRVLAAVSAVNRFLSKVKAKYPQAIMTAYNLVFDLGKMNNSGIIADELFPNRFCLWHSATEKFANTRAYKQFVLDNHYFGNRTKTGHMGIKTNADVMAKFLLGEGLPDEPHTAYEDAKYYELPILTALVKNSSKSEYMNPKPYNYRDWAVRDHYKVK